MNACESMDATSSAASAVTFASSSVATAAPSRVAIAESISPSFPMIHSFLTCGQYHSHPTDCGGMCAGDTNAGRRRGCWRTMSSSFETRATHARPSSIREDPRSLGPRPNCVGDADDRPLPPAAANREPPNENLPPTSLGDG